MRSWFLSQHALQRDLGCVQTASSLYSNRQQNAIVSAFLIVLCPCIHRHYLNPPPKKKKKKIFEWYFKEQMLSSKKDLVLTFFLHIKVKRCCIYFFSGFCHSVTLSSTHTFGNFTELLDQDLDQRPHDRELRPVSLMCQKFLLTRRRIPNYFCVSNLI